MAMACTVVPTPGSASSIVFSVVVPFFVGGGSSKVVGQLGIQPPKSYCSEEVMEKPLAGFDE